VRFVPLSGTNRTSFSGWGSVGFVALDIANLDDDALAFLRERHLATLTTLRADGSPHVVAVGFSYDATVRVARVITWATSQKALNVGRMEAIGQRAVVCQVDGGRWLALEGTVRLVTDDVQPGIDGYAARYQQPKDRDDRAVVEIDVDRILGRG
jgi:F420H(2)-dependent biliverdin reductase